MWVSPAVHSDSPVIIRFVNLGWGNCPEAISEFPDQFLRKLISLEKWLPRHGFVDTRWANFKTRRIMVMQRGQFQGDGCRRGAELFIFGQVEYSRACHSENPANIPAQQQISAGTPPGCPASRGQFLRGLRPLVDRRRPSTLPLRTKPRWPGPLHPRRPGPGRPQTRSGPAPAGARGPRASAVLG